jgi:beta-phosphoglucomutase-like phosphatase (HAD superfamily)
VDVDSSAVIGCFDLDGVLLDTEKIKLAAWSQAVVHTLHPSAAELDALNAYNGRNRGVPRVTKFEYALDYVGAPGSELSSLVDCYGGLLAEHLASPEPMPGAIELISAWPGRRWVVSSAPQVEIAGLLAAAGFPPFDRVCGYPNSKVAALSAAKQVGPIVHFGDAVADRVAARAAGVAFVAVGAIATDPQDLVRCANVADLQEQLPTLLQRVKTQYGRTLAVSPTGMQSRRR